MAVKYCLELIFLLATTVIPHHKIRHCFIKIAELRFCNLHFKYTVISKVVTTYHTYKSPEAFVV